MTVMWSCEERGALDTAVDAQLLLYCECVTVSLCYTIGHGGSGLQLCQGPKTPVLYTVVNDCCWCIWLNVYTVRVTDTWTLKAEGPGPQFGFRIQEPLGNFH